MAHLVRLVPRVLQEQMDHLVQMDLLGQTGQLAQPEYRDLLGHLDLLEPLELRALLV